MINIKSIKPLANRIVTTADNYNEEGKLITHVKNTLKEYQKVLAVGPHVRDIKVGDLVMINPTRYEVKKYEENSVKAELMQQVTGYKFNIICLDGVDSLLLYDSDVDYVIEDYSEESEDSKTKSNIIIPKKDIIV